MQLYLFSIQILLMKKVYGFRKVTVPDKTLPCKTRYIQIIPISERINTAPDEKHSPTKHAIHKLYRFRNGQLPPPIKHSLTKHDIHKLYRLQCWQLPPPIRHSFTKHDICKHKLYIWRIVLIVYVFKKHWFFFLTNIKTSKKK